MRHTRLLLPSQADAYVFRIDDGSEKDTNELTFRKGDILLVFDTSSKWWEAKTKNGKRGSACISLAFMH